MNVVEMNNAVVVMRRFVRKARTCLINKLVRETKLLRKKHGDEKQQQKFTRKADRLVQEVLVLKKIKDDDIILYGIENTVELNDILKDLSVTEDVRALVRIINHKDLKVQLQEFKKKFPDHKLYVELRKKKGSKSQKKTKQKKQGNIKTDKMDKNKSASIISEVNSSNSNLDEGTNISNKNNNSIIKDNETVKPEAKVKCNTVKQTVKVQVNASDESETEAKEENGQSSSNSSENEFIVKHIPVKAVGKEATVKRFTEFLQTQDESSPKNSDQKETMNVQTSTFEKENDSFFISGNDEDFSMNTNDWKSRKEDSDHEHEINTFYSPRLQKTNNRREFFGKNRDRGERFNKKHIAPLKNQPKRFQDNKTLFGTKPNRNIELKSMPQKTKVERNGTINTEAEKLHPSWEARKKQREMMNSGFQGKKIVFDDD